MPAIACCVYFRFASSQVPKLPSLGLTMPAAGRVRCHDDERRCWTSCVNTVSTSGGTFDALRLDIPHTTPFRVQSEHAFSRSVSALSFFCGAYGVSPGRNARPSQTMDRNMHRPPKKELCSQPLHILCVIPPLCRVPPPPGWRFETSPRGPPKLPAYFFCWA